MLVTAETRRKQLGDPPLP